jgi:Tfp pilus assembly protein PilX
MVVELTGGTAGGNVVGSACRPMQSQSAGNPGEAAVYYLIAARAFGPTGDAEAVVQSIYFWP